MLFSSICKSLDRVGAGVIPFPAEPSDTIIILDNLPDTDLYTLRTENEYDLTFNFDISKYIGDVDKLLQHGLIDEEIKIAIAAFDVDNGQTSDEQFLFDCDNDGTPELIYYEVDEVFLNGKKIGELTSGNNQWAVSKNVLTVDVRQLNFPANIGATAQNVIHIKIDSKNSDVILSSGQQGCKKWAAEVDFIAVQFDVIDPFLIIPGFGGSPANLSSQMFKENLMNTYGIPSEIISYSSPDYIPFDSNPCESVELSYKGTINEIKTKTLALAEQWQTDSLNIVGHSKGGLESLYLIENLLNFQDRVNVGVFNNTKVPSILTVDTLATYGTPYEGTLLADWGTGPITGHVSEFLLTNFTPGLCDLTTSRATKFTNGFNFGDAFHHIKMGGDADFNFNGLLSTGEIYGAQMATPILTDNFHRRLWQITGGPTNSFILTSPFSIPIRIPLSLRNTPPNDIMVKVSSALSAEVADSRISILAGKNHGTIVDDGMQNKLIEQFKEYDILWRDNK
tara:strand:- start:1801 stop:3324 length:1524 start_codon:yes stop_codon:yes gene_type:complete